MGYLQKNPLRVDATRAFCQKLAQTPDALGQELSGIEDLEMRIAWAIVGEALHQGVSYTGVAQLVAALRCALPGNQLLRLPAPKEEAILHAMHSVPWTRHWTLEAHVLGILTSVGDWIRRRGEQWVTTIEQSDTACLWKEFGTIYFMGRNSLVRPKVLALLFRLRQPQPLGLALSIAETRLRSGYPWPLPISAGARRWLHLLGPDPVRWMESHEEPDRLRYYQKMFTGLWPGHAEAVVHGLAFFLEPHGTTPLCMEAMSGCANCPIGQMNPMGGQCPGRRI